ncbi:MAG: archease [Armatimonadetes bacterium]|nr:archease [Armatimonadota bacterium]
MRRFSFLNHAADLGIIVYGKDKKEIFYNAALGLLNLLYPLIKFTPKINYQFNFEGNSDEDLLISFLNKILYILEVEKIILFKFKFKFKNSDSLFVDARGDKIDSFKIKRDIKAATYHNLKIEKGKIWKTKIIFDV